MKKLTFVCSNLGLVRELVNLGLRVGVKNRELENFSSLEARVCEVLLYIKKYGMENDSKALCCI